MTSQIFMTNKELKRRSANRYLNPIEFSLPVIQNSKILYIFINSPYSTTQLPNKKYKNNINRVIITVPNAFSWQNIRSTFLHNELINTDHRYWFIPFTLAKILNLSGFEIEEFNFCESNVDINARWYAFIKNPSNLFYRFLFKLFPATRSTR